MSHLLEKFHYCPVCGSPHFEENDFKSKKCADCGFTYYMNAAAAVVCFIVNEREQLLVATRGEEPAKGTLDLIGGFCDCGESATESIIREIKEETGVDVSPEQLQPLFTLPSTYLYSGMTIHTMDTFFLSHLPASTPFDAKDDVAACRWMHISQIQPERFGLTSIRNGVTRALKHPEILEL